MTTSPFDCLVICLKYAYKVANSVDSNQTAPLEQCDQGLHCFPQACHSEYFVKSFLLTF